MRIPTPIHLFARAVALLMLLSGFFASDALAGSPMRRPLSPQQPMWLIHIDTWNYADPQKIIGLVPEDIRPWVVMNISLSINHEVETGKWLRLGDGYETAKSWLRVCAENRMWAMIQPSSGGFSHFSDFDLSRYEEFFREYPNFIGFNYCEQFWGYDDPNDALSPPWSVRINHFANLLPLCAKYGGYLVVSWCGNQWSPNINPIGMLKRIPAFEQACRNHTENYILCEKYTQTSYISDMESLCLGAWLSGYSGHYGIRYDDTGWTDADLNHANFTMATAGAPHLEHIMLTGMTVIDAPELIWTQCFRETARVSAGDGFMTRNWSTFPQFDNMSVDLFRKVLDGTVRIPTRQEVIDRTKVVVINDVNSGGADTLYSSPQTLFEGLYRMDGDGNYQFNKTFFKKTGRYPTIPTVFALADDAAKSFGVKVNRSAYSTRWPTIQSKVDEFNSLFPSQYTGDIYAGSHENGWVIYNPYKTNQTATGTIPFQYNTAGHIEVELSRYTAGVIKETAGRLQIYLNNHDVQLDASPKTNTIRIHGAASQPAWSFVNRGTAETAVPNVTGTWQNGIFTLTLVHNGPLDITIDCSGNASGRLTDFTPATIVAPHAPATYHGTLQYEAEHFDYKNISGIDTNAASGSVTGFRGQGFLRFGTNSAASVRKRVHVPATGTYRLLTRYSVTGGNRGGIDLYVNNIRLTGMLFSQTSTFSDWAGTSHPVNLNKGANTIEFRATGTGARTVYFDGIELVPTAYTGGLVIQENQAGFGGVDGTVATSRAGFTGAGYTATTEASGAGIDWWLDFPAAGTASFAFRYASESERIADLYVNGMNVASNIRFTPTGPAEAWDLAFVHASVPAGLTHVRLQAVSPSGLPDIDFLGIGGETSGGSTRPVADAYVRGGGSANTNFGSTTQLVAKHDAVDLSFNRISYLKFDVAGLEDVQSAKLRLVPFQVDGPANLRYERIDDDTWNESAITWNTRPTAAGTIVASVAGYAVGQAVEIDLTSAVKTEAAGDGILSLRVTNEGWNFVGFHSREHADESLRPVLEYAVIEPTARPGAVKTAYLRFDDGHGTTAADSTGNGWNGTLVGNPTWESGNNARANGALGFGGGSHLTLPQGIVGNLTDLTLSFWVKPGALSDGARVFEFGNGSPANNLYFTTRDADAMARFAIVVDGSARSVEIPSASAFETGSWTHVTVTMAGDTAKLYLNGAEVAANAAMSHSPADLGVTTHNFIGKSVDPSQPAFNGTLDEFRIFNGALSASDVALLAAPLQAPANPAASATSSNVTLTWNSVTGAANYIVRRADSPLGPWSVIGTPKGDSFTDASVSAGMTYHYSVTATNGLAESSASYAPPVTPSTLRLHLRFDETSGSSAADSSGRGWHATLVNAPTWVGGTDARLGGAIHLSGSGQRHLTLPQGVISDLGDCTVAFWLRLGAINTWARVFDFNNGTTGSSMYFVPRTSGGLIRFGLSGQLLEAPPEVQFATNTWTHVAITLTGTTGTLYLNGQPVATSNAMTYRPSFLGMTPFNFIGRSASTADPYLNGRVDEFLIFETPLNAAQIATLASVPAAPRQLQAMGIAGAVILDWEALPGAVSYEIRRSTNPAGPFATLATVPGQVLFHQDNSVTPGITYHYVVAITGGVGTGSVSTLASAAAPPAPPGFTEEETRAPQLEITGALVKLITSTSVQGHAYQLQVSETMAPDSWSALGTPIPGTGTALEFDIPHDPAKDRLFYRILISRQNP